MFFEGFAKLLLQSMGAAVFDRRAWYGFDRRAWYGFVFQTPTKLTAVFRKNGHCFLGLQVLRESRLRQTRPGSPWSAEEHAADAQQALRFLKTGEVLNRKAKEAKKVEDVEHLASWDWLLAIDAAAINPCYF